MVDVKDVSLMPDAVPCRVATFPAYPDYPRLPPTLRPERSPVDSGYVATPHLPRLPVGYS